MKSKVNSISLVFFAVYCVTLKGVHSFPNDVVQEVKYKSILNLEVDCQAASIEKLDLPELVKKAEIGGRCLSVATDVFKTKYAYKLFHMSGQPFYNSKELDNNIVEIDNFDVASKVLRYFGRLISNLKVEYKKSNPCSPEEVDENNKFLIYVNNYRDSLISFELEYTNCAVNVFNAVKGPYNKAENVSISLGTELKTDNIQLNEVFPKVRNLKLKLGEVTDYGFIDCHFSHLNILNFGEWTPKTYEILLKQNAQIKQLVVKGPTREELKIISKRLPLLEDLEIGGYLKEESKYDEINFENVRKIQLTGIYECYSLEKISFKKLNELTFERLMVDDVKCFDFIFKYENITKLTINSLNDTDLSKLIGKYPQLSEADFEFESYVSAQSTIEFVENSPRLDKCTFRASITDADYLKKLTEKLGDDFNIISPDTIQYSIERKVPNGGTASTQTEGTATTQPEGTASVQGDSSASTFTARNAVIILIVMLIGRILPF